MNAETHLSLSKQAKIDSVEKRWIPLRDGADLEDVPDCEFCKLYSMFNIAANCYHCPLNDGKTTCAHGLYFKWDTENDPVRKKKLAQKIIKLIENIDCEAWTAELVKRGVLEK